MPVTTKSRRPRDRRSRRTASPRRSGARPSRRRGRCRPRAKKSAAARTGAPCSTAAASAGASSRRRSVSALARVDQAAAGSIAATFTRAARRCPVRRLQSAPDARPCPRCDRALLGARVLSGDDRALSDLAERERRSTRTSASRVTTATRTATARSAPPTRARRRSCWPRRSLRGEYPPGYAPKRPGSHTMPRFEYLADKIPALAAYLAEVKRIGG